MPVQPQQLHRFYQRACDWINQHLERFNPRIYEDESNPISLYQTKAVGELGLLCMLYHRSRRGQIVPQVAHFLQFINTLWQYPEFKERIVRRPEYFQIYAMIYVVLQQCNVIDDTYRATIQRILDQGYVTATETTPMRLLDRRHLLDCGSFIHGLPSYEELYQWTLLKRTPPVFSLTDTDVYAITHTLFYITDFGRGTAPPMFAEEHLATVRWMVEILLGLYLRRQHWDLVGELLLSCYCLHWYPDIIFELAWEGLLAAQLSDGAVPGPRFSEEQCSELDDSQRSQYRFEQNYHTTIVSAIVGFVIYDQWMERQRLDGEGR